MKFLTFFWFTILIACCSHETCPNGIAVPRNAYKRNLIILEDSNKPRKLVSPKETEKAMSFLEIVSGIKSKADFDHIRTYRNKADFKADLKSWKQWYKKNMCKLTIHYIDSSINSVGSTW